MGLGRRAAAICLALFLLAAGCGDDEEPAEDSTSAPTTEAEADADGDAPPGEPGEDAPSEGRPEDATPPEQLERPLSVEDVTLAVLTRSGSPEQGCEELVTERFVTDAYGSRQGCLAARQPAALATSVEVAEVEESGESATAVAVPSGGPYDGLEVEVGLRADPGIEGAWLVDSLFADVPAGP